MPHLSEVKSWVLRSGSGLPPSTTARDSCDLPGRVGDGERDDFFLLSLRVGWRAAAELWTAGDGDPDGSLSPCKSKGRGSAGVHR